MLKKEQEILDMLAEEAAEVIQAIMKINRHGMDSYHPDDEYTTNRMLLKKEVIDFLAVLEQAKIWSLGGIRQMDIEDTWKKKLKYTHHQGE